MGQQEPDADSTALSIAAVAWAAGLPRPGLNDPVVPGQRSPGVPGHAVALPAALPMLEGEFVGARLTMPTSATYPALYYSHGFAG
jgi:hypothetical protein